MDWGWPLLVIACCCLRLGLGGGSGLEIDHDERRKIDGEKHLQNFKSETGGQEERAAF